MNIIKKILSGIITIILTSLILLLTINFDLKKIIVDGVITEVIKYQITSSMYKSGNKEKQKIEYKTDNEQINEILESDEVQELINKYLDLTVESMVDDDHIDEIKVEEDIIKYIKENKKVLEEKTGVEITDEMIEQTKEQAEEQGISKNLIESIKKTRSNLTSTQKNVLKGYGLLTSMRLRITLIVMILICCALLFILQMKKFRWLKSISSSIMTAGILISAASVIVKIIVSRWAKIEILKTSILLTHGLIEIGIGIILLIIYFILKSIIKTPKEVNKNDISKEFEIRES